MKLTELARKTIEASFYGKKFEVAESVKKKYGKPGTSFVTLTEKKNGDLRGCIGSLEAVQPLYADVMANALNAAFRDPRFFPLSKDELKDVKIEVSVLSEAKMLKYKDEEDLLGKLNHKIGIILKKGYATATFLPQVWEQLPDKIDFLEHLSLKAGLNKDAWKSAEIWYYNVKVEKER